MLFTCAASLEPGAVPPGSCMQCSRYLLLYATSTFQTAAIWCHFYPQASQKKRTSASIRRSALRRWMQNEREGSCLPAAAGAQAVKERMSL